jgi:hypothetical protein
MPKAKWSFENTRHTAAIARLAGGRGSSVVINNYARNVRQSQNPSRASRVETATQHDPSGKDDVMRMFAEVDRTLAAADGSVNEVGDFLSRQIFTA